MSKKNGVYITSFGCASPEFCIDQGTALRAIKNYYGDEMSDRARDLLHKFFKHPSVKKRRLAIDSPEQLFTESPDERMERFTRSAVGLSARAVRKALDGNALGKDQVKALVVNTCTGYICPGLSNYLIEDLGLSKNVQAYDLVGSGCGGAIPNLQLGSLLSDNTQEKVVVNVSVEICSATYQMGDDPALLVSNALFGDAAAAAVLEKEISGLKILASHSLHVPRYREDIRYVYRNGQLHNQLSVSLPAKSAQVVGEGINTFMQDQGLSKQNVHHWALHPGGATVINRLQDVVGLTDRQVAPTRQVLREYGNLSSVSVWFVLREILQSGMSKGENCMMVAFGAGLSAHFLLLKQMEE